MMEAVKTKPFPWMCPSCREKTVSPVQTDYELTAQHDGIEYEIVLHNISVPKCAQCGEAIVTSDISQQITGELRHKVGLLSPDAIRANRERLGMTPAQMAATLRVGEATLTRWEQGGQLQARAVDLLLRLYFESAAVRQACVPVSAAVSPGAQAPAATT